MTKGKHPVNAFTVRGISKLSAPGRYTDGNGLYLVIDRSGAKRWVLRTVVRGRRRDMGLGRHRISSPKLNHRVQSYRKSVPDTTLTVLPVGSQRHKSHADGSLGGIDHGATQIRFELAPVTGHPSAAQYDHVGAIFVPESFARRGHASADNLLVRERRNA